ncbi:hypothetical protein [Spiroplasma platyhelix]|uniref:Transmembrane protein n=1 Tax=Spiroplasma platyhelix PALS-1 TaxID=1276218 RepID=A0A846TQ31_9MOLU|nr:hypothetical protein [Spiroplasma platyhelix]MBE4704039.1 hypothetical protein [Spiroplasma platyhelix PALS-1]NKE38410.1 hypothetical protein [Spiroplasma platyhelix PALS-1]UJB29297.1 hypothetical protein SPLAT_v1c05330 [Spiroplasma platyhelix PALS-1]
MAYNNNDYNHYNNPNNANGYNPYSAVPRNWLVMAQIFGTVFSVIGLIVYISYMNDIYNALASDDLTNKAIVSLMLALIIYFVWRSIYTALIIIRLAKRSSDEELCANRYIISALSLGVGGFFTPFLVTAFPNVATTSTIKPRYFLSKTMAICTMVGFPIFALSYFLPLLVGTNAIANKNYIFDASSTMGVISIIVLTISVSVFALGLMTWTLFLPYKIQNDFDNNSNSKLFKLISTIWMSILTIELVFILIFSFFRLIAAFSDFLRAGERGGLFRMMFALLNLVVTITYVGMVIYITTKTMAGLWSVDGTVTIGKYEHTSTAKNRLAETNMNV